MFSKSDGFSQKELSELAVLEKSSLNRNLKRLFDSNYISREDFPIIRITPAGKSFVNSIIPEWRKAMDEIQQLLGDDGEAALNLVTKKLQKP
jgi:DNA-binding MarR family transcriptional regulator